MKKSRVFYKSYKKQGDQVLLEEALLLLTTCCEKHHQQPVWILIDEYDTPFIEADLQGYWDELVPFMRNLFSNTLKGNNALHRAVMIGILPMAKERMFSDVNHLQVYSLLNEDYAEYFGFTPDEVQQLLTQASLQNQMDIVKTWYNGYQIGEQVIYNPWSIINYLSESGVASPYWVNTGDTSLIQQLIIHMNVDNKTQLLHLLQGKAIQVGISEQIRFNVLANNCNTVWNLLLHAGYLTCIARSPTARWQITLGFPNKEVKRVYYRVISQWLTRTHIISHQNNFVYALMCGRIKACMTLLQGVLERICSVYDMANATPENFYHGLLLGATVFTQPHDYQVLSNREAGYGRFDIIIYPKQHTEHYAVIIECKALPHVAKAKLKTVLQQCAEDALAQIEQKRYELAFDEQQYPHVLKVGVAFHGKQLAFAYHTSTIKNLK